MSPKNPWGSKQPSPPDLDVLIQQAVNRFKKAVPGGGGILVLVGLVLVGLSLWSA